MTGAEARAGWTRRRMLTLGLAPAAALVAAGVTGLELISRGILPGKAAWDARPGGSG